MSQRDDRDARDKIEVLAFLVVVQVAAFAAYDVDRGAIIIREQCVVTLRFSKGVRGACRGAVYLLNLCQQATYLITLNIQKLLNCAFTGMHVVI